MSPDYDGSALEGADESNTPPYVESDDETQLPSAPVARPKVSKATQDHPVPKPVRPTPVPSSPGRGVGAVGGLPVQPAAPLEPRDAGQPTPLLAEGGQQGDPGAPGRESTRGALAGITKPTIGQAWGRSKSGVSRTTPRSGLTQALKVGPGASGAKPSLTTHALRGQDRIIIREQIPVSYTIQTLGGDDALTGQFAGLLVDISLGGVQVEGSLPDGIDLKALAGKNVVVKLEATLPYVDEPLFAITRATWTTPSEQGRYFIGLRFMEISEKQRRLIQSFLIGLQSPTKTRFKRGR
jgi:hypothetical protein